MSPGDRQHKATNHVSRFFVDYIVEAESDAHARKIGRECCLEQTVELPGHLKQVHDVESFTVGVIENIQRLSPSVPTTNDNITSASSSVSNSISQLYRVTIGYPNAVTGHELPQLLNVVFGNSSLKRGISVANVTLSPELENDRTLFPGPKFGIDGIRKILNVPKAPLLMTALKPLGKSSQDFADMAYALAKGGLDIIKDDHGLSNQSAFSPFEERVRLCADAVARATAETGKKCLYAPCLNAPIKQLFDRANYAQKAGCGAVMVLPGLCGWDVVRELASSDEFNLPILIHPALLDDINVGDVDTNHPHGFSHEFLFGKLPRICGGDAVIFPNASGRFQFTSTACTAIAHACRAPLGRFKSIWPTPAGGMKLNRIDEMRREFGDDTLFLIGGALLEQGSDLEKDAQMFAHCCGRDKAYSPIHAMTDVEEDTVKEGCINTPDVVDNSSSVAEVHRVAWKIRRRVLEYTLYNK